MMGKTPISGDAAEPLGPSRLRRDRGIAITGSGNGPVSRALYDSECRERVRVEALLEVKSRALSEAHHRLTLETEAMRAALAETEAMRLREVAALRERSILSEALTALSGQPTATDAIQALLTVLQRDFAVAEACLLHASGDHLRIAASTCPDHAGLSLPVSPRILERSRRMQGVAGLAPGQPMPDRISDYASAIIVPLCVAGEEGAALMLGCGVPGRFPTSDLRLLERVAALAAQSLVALRAARRNALLVSLIEGVAVQQEQGDVLDASLEAVHRAFARLTDMQGEVVSILGDLLGAPLAGADAAINATLARMGRLTRTDRVYVFRLRPDGAFIDNTHEWCAPGIDPARDILQDIPAAMIDHWRAEFDMGRDVLIPDVLLMPDDAPEKTVLLEQGIRSLITVPMTQDGAFQGFVGFDSVGEPRSFLPGEVHLIRSVAKVIASVLGRRDVELALVAAHAETAEQRARLMSVLAAMPDLVVELDRAGRFVTWHSGTIIIPDALEAAFIGRAMEEVLPPDLAAEGRAVLAELDAGRVPDPRSFPFTLMGEVERWWQLSASSMGDAGYLFVLRDITVARNQTAEIERLSEIARRTTNMVIVTDVNRRIEWVNAAFERTTGWALRDVQGRNPGTVLQCSETDPATVAQLREALDRGEATSAEILNRTRDGRDYWVTMDIQPLRDIAGELRGFLAVQTDVTDRRMQAEALRRAAKDAASARATLEAAVNALPDGFVLFDRHERLVTVNHRYREMFPENSEIMQPGVTFETLMRHSRVHGQMHEADGHPDWLTDRLRQFREADGTFETRLPDGRWIQESEHATPDGGRVGLRFDITALKLAEQRALADLADAMEASQDGIAVTDAQGRFLYMNRAHLAMFGITSEAEVLGKPWSLLYEPKEAAWMQAHAIPRLFAEGRWGGEILGRTLDGRAVDQDVSLTLKADGGILCITRDVSGRRREATERERLREELQIAQRREAVGQLAAGLAHDFNNLLATISGSASLIGTAVEPGSVISDCTQRIEAAIGQAAALVRQLLAMGARPSERKFIDLRQSLGDALDLVRASLKPMHRLVVSAPDQSVEVSADAIDILQVLLNLVINARDAIGTGPGEIAVTVRQAKVADLEGPFVLGQADPSRRYALLEVSDTGSGIGSELAASVFKPYVSTKGDKGTGLGLSIVSSVVLSNSGAIALDTALGRGSRFSVLWPMGDIVQSAEVSQAERLTGSLVGRTILLTDDQKDVLDVLAAMLQAAGAEVAPTTEPADVLAAVREDPEAWDLVITDYDMPSMTGAELATAIRASAPKLPVILVTALTGVAGRGGEVFDTILAKPIDLQTLLTAAESAIMRAELKE
jgi:PAS domain S-box-containing protein